MIAVGLQQPLSDEARVQQATLVGMKLEEFGYLVLSDGEITAVWDGEEREMLEKFTLQTIL